jgi:hypothetical protein
MACACKVNRQLDYLHKKYGDDLPKNKKTDIRGKVVGVIKVAPIYLLAIPLIPIFAVYSIVMAARGKAIKIDKFIRKDVRKQQII